jgi:hypothetical protein
MTTPERLRRRQRLESLGIAVLAAALVLAFIYFQGRSSAQQKCVSTFITLNSKTTAVRSSLVEKESKATRRIISGALTAESREDIIKARDRYFRALASIDKVRAENPVEPFPKGVCD